MMCTYCGLRPVTGSNNQGHCSDLCYRSEQAFDSTSRWDAPEQSAAALQGQVKYRLLDGTVIDLADLTSERMDREMAAVDRITLWPSGAQKPDA